MRLRFWIRRLLPQRVEQAQLSEYHDEGTPLYELTTYWRWGPVETRPRTRVLA